MHYSNRLLPEAINRCLDTDISRSWEEIDHELLKVDTSEAYEAVDPTIVQSKCKRFHNHPSSLKEILTLDE